MNQKIVLLVGLTALIFIFCICSIWRSPKCYATLIQCKDTIAVMSMQDFPYFIQNRKPPDGARRDCVIEGARWLA